MTSTKKFVWIGTRIAEERNAGNAVTKRFYGEGQQIGGTAYLFTRDHLGSIREMVDLGGTVRARYAYDPYGRRTKVSGDLEADFGYTGHYYHVPSALHLALYRAYDAGRGRWLSRDPIGEDGGINLYSYVLNNPINLWDPLGLEDYTSEQTQEILNEAATESSGFWGMWNMYKNHQGGAKFDFKGSGHTYCASGRRMQGDEFGNYIAGYAAGIQDGVRQFTGGNQHMLWFGLQELFMILQRETKIDVMAIKGETCLTGIKIASRT